MAEPADISVRNTAPPNSMEAALLAEHNKLVTQLRVLTAKMDADAFGDTDYAALVTGADSDSPAIITTI